MTNPCKLLAATMLCLAIAPAHGQLAPLDRIERLQQLTSVVPKCRQQTASSEIIVCGRREADKYRVPLLTPREDGDPRGESREGERLRLQHVTTNCQERRALQTGCGMVGVTMHTHLGGGGKTVFRKPAD